MKKTLIFLVIFYQKIFSPDTGILKTLYPIRGACRMYPTCSEYMILAIEKHGTIKGLGMGVIRIARCHPYQKNLIDHP